MGKKITAFNSSSARQRATIGIRRTSFGDCFSHRIYTNVYISRNVRSGGPSNNTSTNKGELCIVHFLLGEAARYKLVESPFRTNHLTSRQ